MYTSVYGWVLILAMSTYTIAAAVWDYRFRKIPNKLTLPVFVAGWLFQLFNPHGPMAGLLDGFLGFLLGFGLLFTMWLIGGGGGGDAKLMGALSVWLGYQLTLYVFIVATVFVILGTVCVITASMLSRGAFRTKAKFLGSSDKKPQHPTHDKRKRRIMAYGIPVACATVVVTLYAVPDWPWRRKAVQAQKSAETVSPVQTEQGPQDS